MKRLLGLLPLGFIHCCMLLVIRSNFWKEMAMTAIVPPQQTEVTVSPSWWLRRRSAELCLSL